MNLTKKLVLGVILSCTSLFLINYQFGPFLYQNLSPSAPIGIYRKSFESLNPGDYVICHLPEALSNLGIKDDTLLIKKFIAGPGASYEVTFSDFLINNIKYPVYQLKKLPKLAEGQFTVPRNKVILLNDSPISFDSRYFGPVDKKEIISKIKLLIDYNQISSYAERNYPCITRKLQSLYPP